MQSNQLSPPIALHSYTLSFKVVSCCPVPPRGLARLCHISPCHISPCFARPHTRVQGALKGSATLALFEVGLELYTARFEALTRVAPGGQPPRASSHLPGVVPRYAERGPVSRGAGSGAVHKRSARLSGARAGARLLPAAEHPEHGGAHGLHLLGHAQPHDRGARM